jgi:CheY-like chemotaxis protein
VLLRAVSGLVLLVATTSAPAVAQAPGPESFAQEPRTPTELWSAIDYLVSTGQSKKAIPYLDRFLKSQSDDGTLVQIRDRFGIGSVLRLADDPVTAPYAKPLADRLAAASRRNATQPERLARAVSALTGTDDEQNYGVARLKEAGPYAIPALLEALRKPGISSEERQLLVKNMGRLDGSAVPALVAVLDSGDSSLKADAASALGRIGDARAVPFLIYPAASVEAAPEAREAAQAAIARLTDRPFDAEASARVLTDAAWKYHRHQVEFPGESVAVWEWDRDRKTVAPHTMKRGDAEVDFSRRLVDQALRLQPVDRDARVASLSIALRKAADKIGPDALFAKDRPTFDSSFAAGPDVMSDVLGRAIADRDDNVAAAAATVLGSLTTQADLAASGHPHPLVEALWAPGPRAPLAAARAIVDIKPDQPFPGSSRLVPVLSRYIMAQRPPRAVVIDDNPSRGSQLAGALRSLGYETTLESTGDQGFQAATETADVEALFVSHAFSPNSWNVTDILTNLKSDSRTRNLPVFIYGPRDLEIKRPDLPRSFPGLKYVVQPVDGPTLEKLMGGKPSRLSDTQRVALADEAAGLLASVASLPRSPFAEDLSQAEPALAVALGQPGTSQGAVTALGNVPDADAQRSLADVALDASRSIEVRRTSAEQLARSIQKFGPLVSADQEIELFAAAQASADPPLRSALQKCVRGLRAGVEAVRRGSRTVPPSTTPPATDLMAPSVDRP